jgi:hypothetical protein
VDATGRSGRLGGRKQRVAAPTLALYAYWCETVLHGPETRVEAGESEWYWGAPLPDGFFNATVFVDPARCARGHADLYGRLLRRSALLQGCLNGRRITEVKCCDATSYCDEDPVADNLVKAGEASFSIDPLSSQGVRSAMGSALHGALVLNTMIRRPESAPAAAAFYTARQREAVSQHRQWAGRYYAEAAQRFDTPFWRSRAIVQPSPEQMKTDAGSAETVGPDAQLRLSSEARIVEMPRVEGDFILAGSAVEHPSLARPLAYLDGIDVPDLLAGFASSERACDVVARWRCKMPAAQAVRVLAELFRLGVLVRDSHRG